MTSFNEWLYQRDENIYNEMFEPEGNTQVNQLLAVQSYKQNGLNLLEVSPKGSNMINNKNIEVMEKGKKFIAAMRNYLSEIDSKYNGVLVIGGSLKLYLGSKNPIVNALIRFTKRRNLKFRNFGKKYIVFSENGYEELKKHFRAEQLLTMLDRDKNTPGLSPEEIAKKQARMANNINRPIATQPNRPSPTIPTFAEL
jgi:hypothetical protein